MQEVDAGTHALIAAMFLGTPLAGAHEDALLAEKDFDLSTCLHWLFTTALVTGLTTN